MRPEIWFRGTWLSTQTPTMRTLWVITTRSAGPVMHAWDWWSMTSTCEFHLKIWTFKLLYQIWRQAAITFLIVFFPVVVLCSGTSRTVCPDRLPQSSGRTALFRSTAKTTPTCSSTCVALSAASCQSAAPAMKSLLTKTVCGTCRMRWGCNTYNKQLF